MGLQIVYGRAGSGKSYYCFNAIKDKVKNKENVYMITPEQFSFTAEKKLIDVCENSSSLYAEVITFERIAHRILEEKWQEKKELITKQGKQMLLYSIISKNKAKFNFLAKNKDNIELIDRTITEFKKHNITLELLNNQIQKTNNIYLKKKLEDIYLVFSMYEEKMNKELIDENDTLSIFASLLEKTEVFDNASIYIDEFSGFTTQEYECIKVLLKKAKQVTITMCLEQLQNVSEQSIFYSNYNTYNKLLRICNKEKIDVDKPIMLNNAYRFKSEELKAIEQNLYSYNGYKYLKSVTNLHLFLAMNPYSEISEVARKVNELVQSKNYKYNDIAIITKNQEDYRSLIKSIFEVQKIPIFIDERKTLSDNSFAKFILAVLDVFAKSWSRQSVMSAVKTGFFNLEKNEIYEIDNFSNKFGIRGKAWYSCDFTVKDDKTTDEQLKHINEIRRKISEPMRNFQAGLNKVKTVKEMTIKLYEFIKNIQIEEKLNKKIKQLQDREKIAEELSNGMKIVINIMNELIQIMGEENVSFEAYLELLKIGFSVQMLGEIPTFIDQVTLRRC